MNYTFRGGYVCVYVCVNNARMYARNCYFVLGEPKSGGLEP